MTHKKEIILRTVTYVKEEALKADSAHDWWHTQRVWSMARRIAHEEGADLFVVELGALLHDVGDAKFYGGDDAIGPKKVREFLLSMEVDAYVIEHVVNIVSYVSFRKSFDDVQIFHSKELAIVQDADKLDALGAIGIARTFSYGGYKNRPLYDPAIVPQKSMTKDVYVKSDAPSLNHFYEKILLLKDMMQTKTGKKIARYRHIFVEKYLEEFYAEWEGKK